VQTGHEQQTRAVPVATAWPYDNAGFLEKLVGEDPGAAEAYRDLRSLMG
jgi:hypothetical protein